MHRIFALHLHACIVNFLSKSYHTTSGELMPEVMDLCYVLIHKFQLHAACQLVATFKTFARVFFKSGTNSFTRSMVLQESRCKWGSHAQIILYHVSHHIVLVMRLYKICNKRNMHFLASSRLNNLVRDNIKNLRCTHDSCDVRRKSETAELIHNFTVMSYPFHLKKSCSIFYKVKPCHWSTLKFQTQCLIIPFKRFQASIYFMCPWGVTHLKVGAHQGGQL